MPGAETQYRNRDLKKSPDPHLKGLTEVRLEYENVH